jgi:uncharacterized protein
MGNQIYKGDSANIVIKGIPSTATQVPHGTAVIGVYFDGYPQVVKNAGSQPKYTVRTEKDVMVPMRDGVRVAVDIYRPETNGEKFPAILSWGQWGKDAQEVVRWQADNCQPYYHSPYWDGTLESGNFMYTVPRGYVHVIPDPRGIGNSEGDEERIDVPWSVLHSKDDMYDLIEWIAVQPWCNGNVGMMGPSSYSAAQIHIGTNPPPHLKALHPDECLTGTGDHFHGIYDTMHYHVNYGRHGNDSVFPVPNRPYKVSAPELMKVLPEEELQARLEEALNHPDIKYNSKWYSFLRYPFKSALAFDTLLSSFHPRPANTIDQCLDIDKIKLPLYLGAPWDVRIYLWKAFEVYEQANTPAKDKKLILYPPGFPPRPYNSYHDEIVRWYDYWLKGIDTGVMDEPPIKMFVMGVNKWRFEHEWPLKRTQWARLYLHPGGQLSTHPVTGSPEPERFVQQAPYEDPTVYCVSYKTAPFESDTELTGPVALYLDASIDKDDTNWIVDLLLVDPDGKKQLITQGFLKAAYRALDECKSKPYMPIHPRQDPVPVTPGEKVKYAIALMPTACVFKEGHWLELVIRNQDDLLSRLGSWGVYMLPFMQTVTHDIHFGDSYLLVPHIPAKGKQRFTI